MKKLLFVMGLVAAGLILFLFNIGAEQPRFDTDNQEGKYLMMQASWRPSLYDNSLMAIPDWQLIQFGDEFEEVVNDEIVTPKGAECLFCHHFMYSELSKRTVNYVDKWGENVNPHMYVDEAKADPHHAGKVVPDCLRCHKEHAIPEPTAPVAKSSLNYCYSCHHDESFEACSVCH